MYSVQSIEMNYNFDIGRALTYFGIRANKEYSAQANEICASI